jgi:thioredoxin reductase (NADPH)
MEKKSRKEDGYDLLIIGAGVTGLASAMYAARLGMKNIVLGAAHGSEMPIGGVVTTTKNIENYPGFESISGVELAERIRKHAASYGLVTIKEELVEDVEKKAAGFTIRTAKGKYSGKAVLFATGGAWRKLNVPGGKEFENKGVAYCALCDAPLYKNKIAAVIGGSDAAAKDALILAEYAKKVYIIYRGEKIRAEPASLKKIEANKKIEIINNANVVEVKGDITVKKVVLDREFGGSRELELQGVFVAIGHDPISELASRIGVKTNEKGEVIIDHQTSETNIPGVYAAGDVTDKKFKQAIIGVAEGCTASYSAFEFLRKK